ncbi:glycosyl transferase family 2 [Halorubrum sp. Ib24]|uniref:glycosyltransferase n=1 Tax=Halorubrum sp. Ib24 TaxID=1383850 RepID=UPI000B994735|nr:glycosyltransferase [Halorubrum sp. Ib24]OYR38958.1 glycosyl transferase family 2 [Halorubrum sp. Ib24]
MYVVGGVALGLLALTATPYVCYLALYAWIRPSGSPADKQAWEPEVSVVLPTYNEAAIVETKLDDLMALEYPIEKVELVVVDSSTDETRAIIRDYFADLDDPDLTIVEEGERNGVARAINEAMESVSSEIVFRTDCDSKLAADALSEAVANLADEDVGAVTGQQTDVLGDSQVEQDYRDITARNQILESYLDSTFICHGPCFAFARSEFRPLTPDSLADDTEIGVNIRRSGSRVVMDPAIQFVESGASGFVDRRTRKDRRAMGLVQLLARNRDALGKYGKYGRVVLPFNWWFMILSPWLAAFTGILATAAAVSLLGVAGLGVPVLGLVFFWFGQQDHLGPIQPVYAVADSQVSLLVAQLRLALGDVTGMWDVDRESRRLFE